MGTHATPRSPWDWLSRFWKRRRYQRILNALLAQEPKPMTAERLAQLEAAARQVAGLNDD